MAGAVPEGSRGEPPNTAAECLAVHHIGSKAVERLQAKPIIDILPVVRSIAAVVAYNPVFERLGEFGIPGRRYFCKGKAERTHPLHVLEEANRPDIRRYLAVREYLRAHPGAAEEVDLLKAQLTTQFVQDIEAYCDGKDAFLEEQEQKTLAWHVPEGEALGRVQWQVFWGLVCCTQKSAGP